MKSAYRLAAFCLAFWLQTAPGARCQTTAPPVAAYRVKGVVRSVDQVQQQATIAHEEIPGYMPAMTMSFAFRDAALLATLRAGDALDFELRVTANSAWIERAGKTGEVPAVIFEPTATPSPELNLGDLMPDIDLTDATGRKFHLRDFRGQALAITFVYAGCPLPTYCPLMNRNFEAAQTLLGRMGAGENWHFFSISLDAAHDAPASLAASANAYGADAQHWTFATAPAEKVRAFGHAVGLEFTNQAGRINHNLRTIVLDAAGRIRQIHRGNSWTPQDLAAEIRAVIPRAM